MGPENTQTLIALATFMDKKGKCYPSQSVLGYILGISETQANDRIKKLVTVRFDGRPIIRKTKARSPAGKWLNNVYEILPESGFGIFNTSTANLSVTKAVETKEAEVNTNYTQSSTTPKDLTTPNPKKDVLSKKELRANRGGDGRSGLEPVRKVLEERGILPKRTT